MINNYLTRLVESRLVKTQDVNEQIEILQDLFWRGPAIYGSVPPIKRVTQRFTLGLLNRKNDINQIREFLDYKGVVYQLREYPGWIETTYHLILNFNSWGDVNTYIAFLKGMREQSLM